jgi:hypothetical protein
MPYIFVMSLVGMCLPFYLISRAELVVEVSTAGLLLSVGPLLTVLLAHLHFLLCTERLTWSRFGDVFIGFMSNRDIAWSRCLKHPAFGAFGTGNGDYCDHGICFIQSHGAAPA